MRPPAFGPDRNARTIFLSDRKAARRFLAPVLAWEFEQVIVNHGEIRRKAGKPLFKHAFAEFL